MENDRPPVPPQPPLPTGPPEKPQGRTPPLPPPPPPVPPKRVVPPPPLPPGYKSSAGAEEPPEGAEAQPAPPAPRQRPKTSGWAVASLVMGILGFTCLFLLGSILAIIFGFVGIHEISQSKGSKTGKGMAAAGIAMGIVLVVLVVMLAAVIVPLAVNSIGPDRTVTRTVDAAGASRVNASIEMMNGELKVRGGGPTLMTGTFKYNVKEWRPVIRYTPPGPAGTGEMRVWQASSNWWRFWQWMFGNNDWDIRLGGTAPIDLTSSQSWGDADLDLAGAPLSSLDASSSAGKLTARLSGPMPFLEKVKVDQSAGKATLVMDGEYPLMEDVDVRNSAGAIEVDLTGRWTRDVTVTVENSAGSIVIRLPRDVGVYAVATSSAGDVSVGGLEEGPSGSYVNGLYGTSPVTIRLTVRNSAGNITLK
jgi:Domain of unknown function (DUF4190)/N-terminal domain of toast_rack, DUF2154